MTLERSPRLLAVALIALIIVLFNFHYFPVDRGEKTKQVQDGSQKDADRLMPTATTMARKEMANTGPGFAQAYIQPTPTIFPKPTHTPRVGIYSPEFQRFIEKVADGQDDMIRGVYVSGMLALPVIQQPEGEWAFVSEEQGVVTEFQSAAKNKVIGLLAHNFLSGALFLKLKEGTEVRIVYGNKTVKYYVIEGIFRYQKLTPNNPQSDLIDLSTGDKVTTEAVFNRYYRGKDHVTFQTCLEASGLSNWGLVFTVAVPEEGYEQ
jgi:hypothetical protein